jgi:putative membrane protein
LADLRFQINLGAAWPVRLGRLTLRATCQFEAAGAECGMRNFLIHWLVTAIALAVGARLVPGIHVGSLGVLLVSGLVLGIVNALVRPVLVLLTLPITILTLGLFYLIVNAAAFGLAAALVPGFTVASFGSAIGGALVVSLVSWVLGWLLRPATEP